MAAKAEKFNLMDLLNQRSKQKQEAEEQKKTNSRGITYSWLTHTT